MGASEAAGDDGASDNMVGGLSVPPKNYSGKSMLSTITV
jgi:hypothetical protein